MPDAPDALAQALKVAFAAARSAAARKREELLRHPNVVDVRAGYKFTGGWITDTPAVVVTVLRKVPLEELGGKELPLEVDGVPVDVAAATPVEQLRHLATRAGTRSAVPVVGTEPLLEPGEVPAVEAGVRGGEGGRGYRPPPDVTLTAVGGAMTLLCHASPDAGWPVLQKFLAGTRKSLTVAMYDFGAKHIVRAIETAMGAATGKFTLNLDRRSNPQRKGEFTEEQVVNRFTAALGDRFVSSTAAVGTLYPNAYHIKVAVRDSKAFWLSSGTWQGTNQPDVDASTLAELQRSGHNPGMRFAR